MINQNAKVEITTLTGSDFEGRADKIDLPVGRLVRIEGDDATFIVEPGDACDDCALDGAPYKEMLFFCKAFACLACVRRDETCVILRRLEGFGAASTEPEARRQ